MAANVAFNPKSLELGLFAPGVTKPFVSVGAAGVSAAATVSASIADDTSGRGFRIIELVSSVLVDVVPNDPDFPILKGKHPHGKTLEIIDSSDGTRPIRVPLGSNASVGVAFRAPDPPFADAYSATLRIVGDTWNPVDILITAESAGVATQILNPMISGDQGQQVSADIVVTSLAGPATDVSYETFPAVAGVTLVPVSVHVEPRSQSFDKLTFAIRSDAAAGPRRITIVESAFNDQQRDTLAQEVILTVTVPRPAPSVDPRVRWEQANPFGVLIQAGAKDAWNAGHVNDVLPLGDNAILVGSETGGVWSVSGAGTSIPLSNSWDNPDVNCLAFGPDGSNHFFAGCTNQAGALFESDPNSAFLGFTNWRPVPLVDETAASINQGGLVRIAILPDIRKIVLACGNGVFWSNIPKTGGKYAFKKVQSLPAGTYSGLAVGPDHSIVMSAWGDGQKRFGIFWGDWSTGDLVVNGRATISGPVTEKQMIWTTLSSSRSDPNFMYAAASDALGKLIGVFRSTNGGRGWQPCQVAVVGAPPGKDLLNSTLDSGAGGWIKSINASPFDPKVVSIGWGRGFLSTDSGNTWLPVGMEPGAQDWNYTAEAFKHFHEDVHAVVFDSSDNQQIYVASDGGVGMTADLGKTCFSQFNRNLVNLQFAGRSFSASVQVPDLVGGGLQDNSNVFSKLGAGLTPWSSFRSTINPNDGWLMFFLPTTGHLLSYDGFDVAVRSAKWDGTKFTDVQVIPVQTPKPGAQLPGGLVHPIVDVIPSPHFRRSGDRLLMFAVGCPQGTSDIYGLFGGDDGAGLHWDFIGSVPVDPAKVQISALASRNGDSIMIGINDGRIFSMNPDNLPFELTVTPRTTKPGSVDRFLLIHDSVAFAMYNAEASGLILQLDSFSWDALGANSNIAAGTGLPTDEGAFFTIEVDRTSHPPAIFVATDNNVYVSRDTAESWQLATSGLPKRAHCRELRVGTLSNGVPQLYLTTYGRSLWQADLRR